MFELLAMATAAPTERLRNAVPGLAGIIGFLLLPMLGAWVRLLVQRLERSRPGIARPRSVPGLGLVRAVGLTLLVTFFLLTSIRAAKELREIQAEATVFGPSLQGVVVGIGFWALYAMGLSTLRSRLKNRPEHRVGRLR